MDGSGSASAAEGQIAFMARHKGLSMSEKLRLWKEQKANMQQPQQAAKGPAPAKPTAKADVKVDAAPAPTKASTALKAKATTAKTSVVAKPAASKPATAKPTTSAAPTSAAASQPPTSRVSKPASRSAPTKSSSASSLLRKPLVTAGTKRTFSAVEKEKNAPAAAAATKPKTTKKAKISHAANTTTTTTIIRTKSSLKKKKLAASAPATAASAPAEPTPLATAPLSPPSEPTPADTEEMTPDPAQSESASEPASEEVPVQEEAVLADETTADEPMAEEPQAEQQKEGSVEQAPATPEKVAETQSISSLTSHAAVLSTPLPPSTPASSTSSAPLSSPSAAASDSLIARLQAWKAARGVQLTASASKARVAEEKRRAAQQVKAAKQAALTAAGLSMPPPRPRLGTPSLKLSGLASLGMDSAFSRIQSLMRRSAWSQAEQLMTQLLSSPHAAEVRARADSWVCRAFIAEKLGQLEQVISLYDEARTLPASSSSESDFHDVIHAGFQSFMCRLAGVDACMAEERQPQVLDQFIAPTPIMQSVEETEGEQEEEEGATDAAMAEEAKDSVSLPSSLPPSTPQAALTACRMVMTPVSASLRSALMSDLPPLSSPAASIRASPMTGFTPRAELLRAEMGWQPTSSPAPSARPSALCMTPLASSLAATLRQERTPSPDPTSMKSLLRESERIASRSIKRAATPKIMASAESTPEQKEEEEQEQTNHSVEEQDTRRESLPLEHVTRNLLSEMDVQDESHHEMGGAEDDSLHTSSLSCASIGSSPKQATEQQQQEHSETSLESLLFSEHDQSLTDNSMQDTVPEEADEDLLLKDASTESSLFAEDDFIPGLSTPAPAQRDTNFMLGSAQRIRQQPSPRVMDSPARNMASPTRGTPSKSAARTARTLTPSKAAAAAALADPSALEGSSRVVLASVRAHPRDALKMGSATFLSPVRRSSRHATPNKNDAALDSVDQQGLTKLLEQNNYAYRGNPALLGRQGTPIPIKKQQPQTSKNNNSMQLESIQEQQVEEMESRGAAATKRHATPIPLRTLSALSGEVSGASVVVLQPVRARSRRSSAAAGVVDPKSDEFLLSPVRRSSRHTAPQSISELTHLLAHTKYAFQPNPLLEGQEDPMQLLSPAATKAAAPTPTTLSPRSAKTLSLAAIHEEEEVEEEGEEQDRDVQQSQMRFEEELQRAEEEEEEEEVTVTKKVSPMAAPRSSARIGTPLPTKKTVPVTFNWEPSTSSASSSSSSSFDSFVEVVKPANPLPRSNAHLHKDADGFFVPLPPKKGKRAGQKRKQVYSEEDFLPQPHSYVEDTAFGPSSLPAQPSSRRTATPRPLTKKQRRTLSADNWEQALTPTTRRTMRVATPIR